MSDGMTQADVVIAGGGYVGFSLAVALAQADPTLRILLADARPGLPGKGDERASAIAASARRLLTAIGVYEDLADAAQPILDMIVTDSRNHDAIRPTLLSFDGEIEPGEPFAHMIPNALLIEALAARAQDLGVSVETGCPIDGFDTGTASVTVRRSNGPDIETALLVAADGVRSRLRGQAGIGTVSWRYRQKALVATLGHENPHEGRAEEHFFPSGPLALLPLTGNRSSLVWTERPDAADRLARCDEDLFLFDLAERTGHHLGRFELLGPRQTFPLGLLLVREFVRSRFALIGDAAHGIHPIAGQGLNMGFRDVAALAEVLIDARRLGLDIGTVDILRRYEQWRRFDTWQMGAVTDGLNRLFSNDNALLRGVRDLGLGMVDRMPAVKSMFIREAAGVTGETPRLMQGLAL